MSGYLQRLVERAAPRSGLGPPSGAMTPAGEAAPAGAVGSPVAAQDQRLHDPLLAASLLSAVARPFEDADGASGDPPLSGRSQETRSPAPARETSLPPSRHGRHDPTPEAAARPSPPGPAQPAPLPARITERTIVQPPPVVPDRAAPWPKETVPPPAAPPPAQPEPAAAPPADAAPALRPAPPREPPALTPETPEALPMPEAPAPRPAAQPIVVSPAATAPPLPVTGAVPPSDTETAAAPAPVIEIQPPPLAPPAPLPPPLPAAAPLPAARPAEAARQGERPPVAVHREAVLRETPPAPRPPVSAETASRIGPLARRRRAATLFGLRRR